MKKLTIHNLLTDASISVVRIVAIILLTTAVVRAQKPDSIVINKIINEANTASQLEPLAHELLDVIGSRLVGSPQMKKAADWAVAQFSDWGIPASIENWGTWRGWERGITHVDLVTPRVRTLEATQLAWSGSTGGKTIAGEVVVLADLPDSVAFAKWLPTVKGKFVLVSALQPTGRTDENWEEFGTEESVQKMKAEREKLLDAWSNRLKKIGASPKILAEALEKAGAAGIFASYWSKAYGSNKIFGAHAKKIPTVDLALEDYGLLYRLAESGQKPKVNVRVDAKELGVVPAFNVMATIKGTEKPGEYVMLSAHFDSWDGASGATDNGTGTLVMMEAARLLKKFYPNPKRTILIGLWGSEEQGLNGSAAFVEDNPKIITNLQALFNQDNGTGRVVNISGQGFLHAYDFISRWLTAVPQNIKQHIVTDFPGRPGTGGSDFASFVTAGAPGFSLSSTSWSYGTLTWHTNKDTYDKLVFDEVRNNAILTAILAYMASEDPEKTSRAKINLPLKPSGEPASWPSPRKPNRKGGQD